MEDAGAVAETAGETTEGQEIITEEEEVEPQRVVKTPYTPSVSEVAEHRVTHSPYWCDECREAFGREAAHAHVEHRAAWVPVVSTDYLFLSARGVFTKKEWKPEPGDSFLKILVIVDSGGKCMFAHAVPQKGIDESGYAVDCFASDVAWLGWARLIVRSDNEPALAKLVVQAIKAMKVNGIEQASAEDSVPYDPQSNGAAEAAVKLLKGTLRALQLGLEKQIGAKIPPTHPVMTWMVRHAAYVRNVCIRGSDRLRPYQRTKGRTTSGPRLIGFGEMCAFKKRSHEPLADANDRRWNKSAWIGVDTKTGQYMVWDGQRVAFCRTISRLMDSQKWSSDELAKLRVTPWQMHTPTAPDIIFQEKRADN